MSRTRTFALFIPIVIVMIALDQVTKGWAASSLRMGVPGADLGLFRFELVHNTGAAFGMGQGAGIVFAVVAAAVVLFAILWLALGREHALLEVIGLSLVVAGGIGNCIDRLVTGYVVDFIKFTFIEFPVFNVADICVTCGVVLFLIALLKDAFSSDERSKEGAPR